VKGNALIDWWQGLAARERGFLSAGALVILLILIYQLLVSPPLTGIGKLRDDLPQLREQNAAMRAMADEATRLRAAAGNAPPTAPNDRVAAVRRSLERAGLWSANAAAAAAASSSNAPTTPQRVQKLSVGGTVTTVAAAPTTRAAPPEISADGERVRVRFDDIDYGVWIAWLASAETELSARASRVSVAANAPKSPVGHVHAEALLDWSTPSGASPSRS
jgi:type II secretory pathway component PulM